MRNNEVRDQIKRNAPPNSSKNITREILYSTQEADRVIDLWEVLEEEDD